jgi:hypothetical protein
MVASVFHFHHIIRMRGNYPTLELLTPLISWSHHKEITLRANVWNDNNRMLERINGYNIELPLCWLPVCCI